MPAPCLPLEARHPRLAFASESLVQTPAQAPIHPDERRFEQLKTAWMNGHAAGERVGRQAAYIQGWRWGLVCGGCSTVCAAILGLVCLHTLGWA